MASGIGPLTREQRQLRPMVPSARCGLTCRSRTRTAVSQLTRERVVAEALAVIAQDGVHALTMRRLAARLGSSPAPCTTTSATNNSSRTWSWTTSWPRSTSTSTPPRAGPWSSSRSWPTGSGRCWRPIPGWPASSRPATPWDPTPWPWPRPSSTAAGGRVRCPRGRAGLFPAGRLHRRLCRERHPDLGQRAPRPRPSHQDPAAPVLPLPTPTASPPWSPWASTVGSTTATNGSSPASRWSSPGLSRRDTPPPPRRRSDDGGGTMRRSAAGPGSGHAGHYRAHRGRTRYRGLAEVHVLLRNPQVELSLAAGATTVPA